MGCYGCGVVQGYGGNEKQEKKRVKWSRNTCFSTHGHGDKKTESMQGWLRWSERVLMRYEVQANGVCGSIYIYIKLQTATIYMIVQKKGKQTITNRCKTIAKQVIKHQACEMSKKKGVGKAKTPRSESLYPK